MAEAMGINTLRYKVTVFVLAALLASLAGWLLAHFQRTVNPSPFGLKMGIEYLFMAVIGGVGHVWGALAGAALVKVTEDQLQVWLPRLIGGSGNYELIVFGIVLVLVLHVRARRRLGLRRRRCCRARRARDDWAGATPLAERAKPTHGECVLEVRAVRKEFGGLVAVNGVSFDVAAGEIVGLIGPNGAGKSTTFNLITGLLGLTRGEVRFRGASMAGMPSREIARLGMAPHLPARAHDPDHDGAGERRPRRARAQPRRHGARHAAARSAPRSGACCARPSGSSRASAWARTCTSWRATSRSARSA